MNYLAVSYIWYINFNYSCKNMCECTMYLIHGEKEERREEDRNGEKKGREE
jgi:hypothetical protein